MLGAGSPALYTIPYTELIMDNFGPELTEGFPLTLTLSKKLDDLCPSGTSHW